MAFATVICEEGYEAALLGLGLSFGKTSLMTLSNSREIIKLMSPVAQKLLYKEGGHNKFLRQIGIWADMTCPFFLWKQIDTYKVGTTAQSERTMHTLLRKQITQDNFEDPIDYDTLQHLEELRKAERFEDLNNELPQGWLQRRIVSMNYAVLQNMILRRRSHKLKAWRKILRGLIGSVKHPELLPPLEVAE